MENNTNSNIENKPAIFTLKRIVIGVIVTAIGFGLYVFNKRNNDIEV
jgi:hypothetical protein